HEKNVLGAARGNLNNITRKVKLFFKYKNGNIIRKNSKAFYKVYGELISKDKKLLLEQFNSKTFKNNLRLGFNKKIKRQNLTHELIFRILIIINFI
ncbi:MAG: hypothetical protein ACK5LY_00155, partial [Lachnospirales bacterium]